MVCHSLNSPARQLFHPATNQPWFQRRSIWLMTGWRMIWRKCSQRRRGGFGWNRVGCGERTPPRRQQQEVKTRPAEVMIVLFFFHSISLHMTLCVFYLYYARLLFQVLQSLPPLAGISLWKRTALWSLTRSKWPRCQGWSGWANERSTGHIAPPLQMTMTWEQRRLRHHKYTCRWDPTLYSDELQMEANTHSAVLFALDEGSVTLERLISSSKESKSKFRMACHITYSGQSRLLLDNY